jgi:hypothetical protein
MPTVAKVVVTSVAKVVVMAVAKVVVMAVEKVVVTVVVTAVETDRRRSNDTKSSADATKDAALGMTTITTKAKIDRRRIPIPKEALTITPDRIRKRPMMKKVAKSKVEEELVVTFIGRLLFDATEAFVLLYVIRPPGTRMNCLQSCFENRRHIHVIFRNPN